MKGLKIKYQNFHFENLLEVIKKKKTILVTGGSNINFFLKKVFKNKSILNSKKSFFISDERISDNTLDTNHFKIEQLLKKKNKRIKFYRIISLPKNLITETNRYSSVVRNGMDIAFLSLGEKYHIASLFYNYPAIYSSQFTSITYSYDFKFLRISVNKRLLSKIKKIYLFINGKKRLKEFRTMINKKLLDFYFNQRQQKKIIVIYKK